MGAGTRDQGALDARLRGQDGWSEYLQSAFGSETAIRAAARLRSGTAKLRSQLMHIALATALAALRRRSYFRCPPHPGYLPHPGYKLAVATLALSLSGWAMAATALPLEPLSLDEALRVAEIRSYALAAQDAAATAAGEMAVAARQLPDPVLRLAVDNLPIDGADRYSFTDDFMTMRSIGVMQTMTGADKRRARATRFEREGEAAQTTHTLELTKLRRDTALAWLERYYQEQMIALLQRLRDETALQIDAAEAAYRAGRGPQADVFMARAAVAQIEDRIRATEAQRANATTMLARWIGERASAPLGHGTRYCQRPAGERQPGTRRRSSPRYRAAGETGSGGPGRGRRGPPGETPGLGKRRADVQPARSRILRHASLAACPCRDQGNRQDRELAAKLALAAQMGDEREEMTRQHLAEIRRWQQSWRADLDRLAAYDRTLVPLASERTQAALAAYRGARGPLTAVRKSPPDGNRHRPGAAAHRTGCRRPLGHTGIPAPAGGRRGRGGRFAPRSDPYPGAAMMNMKKLVIGWLAIALLGAGSYALYTAGAARARQGGPHCDAGHGCCANGSFGLELSARRRCHSPPSPGRPQGRRYGPRDRPPDSLLSRPHGAGKTLPRAGQIALHGHDDGAGLCGRHGRG